MGDYDLIERCEGCSYCPIEDMLTPAQRQRRVLDDPIPVVHIHREVVEQICGQQYDGVCEMKYAFERLSSDDRRAIQNANVAIYLWDLGKKYGRRVELEEGFDEWGVKKDMGRGIKECYAARFREIWDLGMREERQSLSSLDIYEIVVAQADTYELAVKLHGMLAEESKARHNGKLNI